MRKRPWPFGEPNPLAVRDLRGRMRGARAFVLLTVYLLLLTCLTTLVYAGYGQSQGSAFLATDLAGLGSAVFGVVVLLQLLMVTFVAPAFTVGAISGERDRRTYDLLRVTLLPARSLVGGKLLSALVFVGLLLLAAIPLQGLAFMLGGVAVEELVLSIVILSVAALANTALGIFFSARARTSLASTALTYGVTFVLTIGLPLITFFSLTLLGNQVFGGPYSSGATPSFLLLSTLVYVVYLLINLNPIVAAILTRVVLLEEGTFWFFPLDLANYFWLPRGSEIWMPSGWIVYTIFYLLLALALIVLTTRRVRRQEDR